MAPIHLSNPLHRKRLLSEMQKYRSLVRVDWEEPTGRAGKKGKREVVMGQPVPKAHHKNGQRGRAPQMKEQLPFDLGKPAVSWYSLEA